MPFTEYMHRNDHQQGVGGWNHGGLPKCHYIRTYVHSVMSSKYVPMYNAVHTYSMYVCNMEIVYTYMIAHIAVHIPYMNVYSRHSSIYPHCIQANARIECPPEGTLYMAHVAGTLYMAHVAGSLRWISPG